MNDFLIDPYLAEFPHNAINDAESFLWVMGYLITRYEGPGKGPKKMTPELNDASKIFNGDQKSQLQKLDILNNKEKLCEFLKHVSPEFVGLKKLMYAWHYVIHLAHCFTSGMEFNYPHWALLQGIKDALTKVQAEAGTMSTEGAGSIGRN